MALIIPLVNPSRNFHDVCAYWLMSSEGSRAAAQAHHASTTPASMPALPPTFRMPSMLEQTTKSGELEWDSGRAGLQASVQSLEIRWALAPVWRGAASAAPLHALS